MKEILRRTWAEIDLDALARDFAAVRQAANKNAKVCCVIKADAYGHGAVRMAQEFEALGADWFAVSNLEEALQLRLGGISRPMLVLGYTPPEEAATLAKHRISQCVYSLEYAQELSHYAVEAGATVHIHVKIDTGMSRLGFYFQDISRDEATVQEVKAACTLPGLYPEGIFTHFAVSDEGQAGDAFTMRQFGCFKEMIESLLREGISFAVRHCANSAAVFDYPLSHLDMVRAGIVIYGLYPSAALRNRPQLTPVLALKSVVSPREGSQARGHHQLRPQVHRGPGHEGGHHPRGLRRRLPPHPLRPGGPGAHRREALPHFGPYLHGPADGGRQRPAGSEGGGCSHPHRPGRRRGNHRRRAGRPGGQHQLRGGLRPLQAGAQGVLKKRESGQHL